MLRSAFIAFFRSFTRHPLYALLNLLGLSFGIAAFIMLSLLYRFETGYESWTPERPHIYATGLRFHFSGMSNDVLPGAMGGLLDEIRSAWPQTDGTRDMNNAVIVHRGAEVFSEQEELVDANFLTFFQMPVLRGSAAAALADPSHIVLSASLARKYFGTIDVLGRTLTLSDEEGYKDYTISAVIADLPKNSDLKFDMLRLLTPQRVAMAGDVWRQWGTAELMAYLKFKSPAEAAAFAAQLPAFTDRQVGQAFGAGFTPHKLVELVLVPLADMHLLNPKDKAAITSLGLAGILALVLALINYVNLATARAGLRAREVAVRKTLGAPPPALRAQFLVEATLTLLLAFLMALSAVELGLPLINAAGGLSLALDYRAHAVWILGLLGFVVLAGLAAALYPALVLSGFKPAQVLASSRMPGGGRLAGGLRAGLAMLQFAAVVVAFILMAGFMLQVRHVETADLGFKRDNLMIVNSVRNTAVTQAQREAFIAAAGTLPGVTKAAIGGAIPGDTTSITGSSIVRPGRADNPAQAPIIYWSVVGPDYFKVVGARLLAGRFFDPQRGEDQMFTGQAGGVDHVSSVVVSRIAIRNMGFASPQAAIGQTATFNRHQVRIVGVVDDMRFYNPREAVTAKLYLFDVHASLGAVGLVRYQGVGEPAMRQALRGLWRQIVPGVPFDAVSAAANLDKYYKPERERSHMFTLGTGIAALIGCIGLYGMAAFNTGRRVREIGMRKVLGASRGQMVRLLLVSFLRPVVLASLIAWPLGWIALKNWLAQFDDVIAMPLWVFPSASAAALLIAVVTVAGVALAAANTEPGKALRHE